jgi:fluoride exporter
MEAAALVLGVAALGGAGAVGRFLLDAGVQGRMLGEFPLGTLVVNLSGAFLLGIAVGTGIGHDGLLLVGTATLASFTTFSTWVFEAHRLAEDDELGLAAASLAVGLAAGLVLATLGRALGGVL